MTATATPDTKRVRVKNTRDQDFVFPPVRGSRHRDAEGKPGRDWPALRIPSKGSYNVLVEYLDMIRGQKATAGARKAYEQATTDHDGKGPMLIVSENPRDIKAKEGIEPPKSLMAYGEDKAIVIVQHADTDALKLWAKNEKRDAVKAAIEARLSEGK